MNIKKIDIPFEHRNSCFYCGEIKSESIQVTEPLVSNQCDLLEIPTCKECTDVFEKFSCCSVDESREIIRRQMIKTYRNHLSIGASWAEEELVEASFAGSALGGFGSSAWEMYKIAKKRVSFKGWSISVDSYSLGEADNSTEFQYDDISFTSHRKMVEYIADIFQFNLDFFADVVGFYGSANIEAAITYCNMSEAKTPKERENAIYELQDSQDEYEFIKRYSVYRNADSEDT